MFDVLLDIAPFWGLREPFSALSHGLGALMALGVSVLLVRRARAHGQTGWAVAVFGVTVVLTFTTSALFHVVTVPPEQLEWYGTLDHASIFLLIAGTGTAIYSSLDRKWAPQLLAATWGLAIIAITLKLFAGSLPDWTSATLHLAVGWTAGIGLFALALSGYHRQLRSFLLGAFFFSVGAIVFAVDGPVVWPGVIEGHEVFHVLVLAAEAFHVHFVYQYCTCSDAFCPSVYNVANAPLPPVSKLSAPNQRREERSGGAQFHFLQPSPPFQHESVRFSSGDRRSEQ